MTIAEGQTLSGSYRIVRRIGGGGMGVVFEAQHLRLPRRFAVKVLRAALHGDAVMQRFRREAELTSQLQHPNIVEVVDYNVADDTPFFVMPFLEGEDLACRLALRGGRLALAEVATLVAQVGSALAATHARGIVHRDLKPKNIFLARGEDGREQAKVLDFGISKLIAAQDGLTRDGAVVGSPRYMGPEQAVGRKDVDARADICALGTVVYEALRGAPAFPAESELEALTQVINDDPIPLLAQEHELPPAVVTVVGRALVKERAARYQCIEALVEDLLAAAGVRASWRGELHSASGVHLRLSGELRDPLVAEQPTVIGSSVTGPTASPLTAATVPDGERPRARRRRRSWLAVAATAGIAVIAAAAIGVTSHVRGRPLRAAARLVDAMDWREALAALERIPEDRRGGDWPGLLERCAHGLWVAAKPAGPVSASTVGLAALDEAEAVLRRHPELRRAPRAMQARAGTGIAVIERCLLWARLGNAVCDDGPANPDLDDCLKAADVARCRRAFVEARKAGRPPRTLRCTKALVASDCLRRLERLLDGDAGNAMLALDAVKALARGGRYGVLPFLERAIKLAPLEACDLPVVFDLVKGGLMMTPGTEIVSASKKLAGDCAAALSHELLNLLHSTAEPRLPLVLRRNLRTNLCTIMKSSFCREPL